VYEGLRPAAWKIRNSNCAWSAMHHAPTWKDATKGPRDQSTLAPAAAP
jgi:hypothetical protein